MSKSREELVSELEECRSRLTEIDSEFAGQYLDPASERGVEFEQAEQQAELLEKTIKQLDQRAATIQRHAQDPAHREEGTEFRSLFNTPKAGVARGEDIYDLTTVRASAADPAVQGKEFQERALRSVENAHLELPRDDDEARARANVEALIRKTDSVDGRFSRYLLAVGSPAYKRAFGKWLQTHDTGLMDRQENAAWIAGQQAQRAMSLTAANGGYAVPYELDTTILNTSNGVVNPIRQIARVQQISTDEWRGITSAGITVSYAAEAAETTDNSPTLAQPTVSTERWQGFAPFSIEIGQDWQGMVGDLTELFRDARDTLEAGKFVSGTGTNEPFGVMTGATTTVAAATGLTITLANLYSLKNALPPRYRNSGRAAFLANVAILDRFRQFDTVGSPASVWADSLQDGTPSRLLNYPVFEASEITGTITNGTKVAVFGDFSRYLIVDRIGMTVDVIPHLFGANRRPTGERGLFVMGRNGAKVLDANAFRALTGTT
jgi:HK97 family phage major capsid protein